MEILDYTFLSAIMNTDAPRLSIPDPGQYIFATHCAACHSIGQGDKIGPDLLGVTSIRDRTWLRRFIATPEKNVGGEGSHCHGPVRQVQAGEHAQPAPG
jgi:mono/diheme cytochrome c family protein